MNGSDIASWLRDEHEKLRGLSSTLSSAIAVIPKMPQPGWLNEVRSAFDQLRDHLNTHMTLEERDGYLTPVVDARPALSRVVQRLAHEHKEFRRLLDGIQRDFLSITAADRLLIGDCFRRIQELMRCVEHHEKDENLLVMSTFGQDLGTTD